MLIRSTLVAASLWALSSYSALANFADIVSKTKDSVCLVTFNNTGIAFPGLPEKPKEDYMPEKPNPFDEYLKENQLLEAPVGAGTCFIITHQGKKYIVTNHHVAKNKEQVYKITFHEQIKHYPATLIANDKISDLAVLELSDTEGQRQLNNMPAVEWGDSEKLRSGDSIYAIGHPLSMGWSVTKGIVSFNGRRLQNTWQAVIQSDVSINTGNSGGPMFDMYGKVIGVNSFIFSPGTVAGSIGINFSVDGNQAQYIVGHLLKYGKVKRSRMGLAYAIDKDAGHFEVSAIQPGGPAERADLKVGDLLLKINGRFVINQASIGKAMDKVMPDTEIEVVIERENEILVKKITTALVDELINY